MQQVKELPKILIYLIVLVLISSYRNISPFLPAGSFLKPYLVYAVYMIIILCWAHSIRSRFTQKSMRIYLLSEAGVALLWMTVRFIQNAYLKNDIAVLRYTGYFIFIPVVLVPLLGFYASFGLGHGDDYHLSRKWYLLIVPAAVLILLALSDEQIHFLFQVLPEEEQPNLYFHPYTGLYVVMGWGLMLLFARTLLICRRNHIGPHATLWQRLAPFSEPIMILIFSTPYMVSSFWVDWEPIEFSAGALFIEAVSWEIYIGMGLIPVNTQYAKVFNLSTVNMQIINPDGTSLVKSLQAPELSKDVLAQLKEESVISMPDGQELQIFHMHDHDLIWQRDVVQLHASIDELRHNTEELKQESDLLAMELEFRAEDSAAKEKNAVYNQLSAEVSRQLSLMTDLLEQIRCGSHDAMLFKKICFIGTYVKRRCNLRLIELSEGTVADDDLIMSLQDMMRSMKEMGVEVIDHEQIMPAAAAVYGIRMLDIIECVMEQEEFAPKQIEMNGDGRMIVISRDAAVPISSCINDMAAEKMPSGYCIHLRKETHDEKL